VGFTWFELLPMPRLRIKGHIGPSLLERKLTKDRSTQTHVAVEC